MPEKRLKVEVSGVVQGVGFRPFVRNLAVRLQLRGSVRNEGTYVSIEIQGGEQELAAFLRALSDEAPARSDIRQVDINEIELADSEGFVILQSVEGGGEALPSPDIAICSECRRELYELNGRRYLHPFINCTACGPRLTIVDGMPYDRQKTSMAHFDMCEDCSVEYGNPVDRRYHAQPVCCNECGPQLSILYPKEIDGNPITETRRVLRKGGIAAVKGIGGFHLCCDARNAAAVTRLRELKGRPSKPFAVMVRDIEAAMRECKLNDAERELLESPQRPILLAKKKSEGLVCHEAAPGCPELGIMLPYAPVQLLLFDYPRDTEGKIADCLIMTSGNKAGSPICINDAQALDTLSGICDIILTNNRDIRLRADDSVLSFYNNSPYMLRRSRGYAPMPVELRQVPSANPLLAVGGELKNTFCLTSKSRDFMRFYLSPYVGDLTDPRSLEALDGARRRMSELLRIKPQFVVCDLHPGYNSTLYADSLGLPVVRVQHHFAHTAACMAENGLDGEVIGVAFDGTGYGSDGTIWGGEFLRASYRGFERIGHIEPFMLAGGDVASREGWRSAVGILLAATGDEIITKNLALKLGICSEQEIGAQLGLIRSGMNCVTATSAGRLFDAAAAVLGIMDKSSYEGEAAAMLEASALRAQDGDIRHSITNTNAILLELVQRKLAGESQESLALAFHKGLSRFISDKCNRIRELTGISRVTLSGGCFANRLLLLLCETQLNLKGFEVFHHSEVPCGDGGIALGQAAIGIYSGL